jgi:hypothetical protein
MKYLSLLLGALFVLSPLVASAQTTTVSTSQRQAMIAALYAELAQLEQEIQQILTQQAQQASTTQQIIPTQQTQSQQIQKIAQNTAPLFGGTEPAQPVAPSCTPNPQLTSASLTSQTPPQFDQTGGYYVGGTDNLAFSFSMGCTISDGTNVSWGLALANGANAGAGLSGTWGLGGNGIKGSFIGTGSVWNVDSPISLSNIPGYPQATTSLPLFLHVTVGSYSTTEEVQ